VTWLLPATLILAGSTALVIKALSSIVWTYNEVERDERLEHREVILTKSWSMKTTSFGFLATSLWIAQHHFSV
jgi:hypothetical protein